jgi:hypothetical protein
MQDVCCLVDKFLASQEVCSMELVFCSTSFNELWKTFEDGMKFLTAYLGHICESIIQNVEYIRKQ